MNRGFSFNRNFHLHIPFWFSNKTVLFLEPANHVQIKIRFRIPFFKKGKELLINIVSGGKYRPLIFFCGNGSVHDTEINGSGADINDQGIIKRTNAIGHGKGFGNNKKRLGKFSHRLFQGNFINLKRLRRHADNSPDLISLFGPLNKGNQVMNQLRDRLLIPGSALLDNAVFQGSVHIKGQPVFDGLLAKEDGFTDDLSGDKIPWPADITFDPFFFTVIGGNSTS